MKNEDLNTKWACPECPYEIMQPETVVEVAHLCGGLAKKQVRMVRQLDGWDLI